MKLSTLSTLGLLLLAATWAGLHAQPATEALNVDHFDRNIAPILARHCLDCHSGAKPRGGLDLTSRQAALKGGNNGKAVVPGTPEASLLWKHVSSDKMPPRKPLPPADKKVLRKWLAAGAAWGTDPIDAYRFTTDTRAGYDWWSLQAVQRPALPAVKDEEWARQPIDHFILAGLEAKGLIPSAEASRQTLIRRLYFDLIGLPPTPAEVQNFVSDPAPDAYEKLVDRLLASPQYGERWARHWLDIVRFGESNGFEFDELRLNAWRYRDWVIDALNQDMPFDQFARLQLAGDVLQPDDPLGIVPTGFLVAGAYDSVGQKQQSAVMKAVVRQDELEDIVGTVGQTFLGLTIHCARCHDHKFDPVRQEEYYRLTAALGGVYHGERDLLTSAARQALAAKKKAREAELATTLRRLQLLEEPIRKQILAERKKTAKPAGHLPEPLARWNFTTSLKDSQGVLHAKLHGSAKITPGGLVVDGKTAYAASAPLTKDVKARTLVARVQLSDLAQRGGAVISLQTLDGNSFDAIVFGEQQPGHWMAGSDFFKRTRSFQGSAEAEAATRPVHLALVYAEDGTVTAYRDGELHGKPYKVDGPLTFTAGKAQLVFGVRHTPALPGRMLAGTIASAELFDRALSAAEVAALAGAKSDYIPEGEIVARLDAATRSERAKLLAEIEHLEKELKAPPAAPKAYAVAPRQPGPAHLLLRGNPAQKGALVTPGGVAALAGLNAEFGLSATASDAERRKKLAEWVTHPKNPLLARVIVNRLWQHHFGVGLVDTPNDFGFSGGRPSHPELLDWLASELVQQKFSLKALHRLMVTSAAYRQSSAFRPDAAKVDAGNRLLWRKSPARLEAEAVRDTMLSVAGQLNLKMGGPGFQDFTFTVRGSTYLYAPADPVGPEFQRRTIYRTLPRSGRNPLLDTLDCPDPSAAAHKRPVTTTPLQALALLNNSFVLRTAENFADRVKQEAGADVSKQIAHAYRLAYGRPPTAKEMSVARPVVEQHGLFTLCRAIFNSNEFLYID